MRREAVILCWFAVAGCSASASPPVPPVAEPPADPTVTAAASATANATVESPKPAATATASAEDASSNEPPPIPPNTAVLHIGDSFALAGFAQALKPKMKALGVRYEVRAETSSFTTTWSEKMEMLVQNTQPDLVIINLGANEIQNPDPELHAHNVRKIVALIGNRPCVWVAPPLWKVKETGILEVIKKNSKPCRFFDTNALVKEPIERQKDAIHPTDKGGALWADAFWTWLNNERAPRSAKSDKPWALKPSPPEEHAP